MLRERQFVGMLKLLAFLTTYKLLVAGSSPARVANNFNGLAIKSEVIPTIRSDKAVGEFLACCFISKANR